MKHKSWHLYELDNLSRLEISSQKMNHITQNNLIFLDNSHYQLFRLSLYKFEDNRKQINLVVGDVFILIAIFLGVNSFANFDDYLPHITLFDWHFFKNLEHFFADLLIFYHLNQRCVYFGVDVLEDNRKEVVFMLIYFANLKLFVLHEAKRKAVVLSAYLLKFIAHQPELSGL